MTWLTFVLALLLALIHLLAGRMRFLDVVPRSRWLSLASGSSVAYVFGHLMPELAAGQRALDERLPDVPIPLDAIVWFLALVGLSIFYGLERRAKLAREGAAAERAGRRVYRLHMLSFGVYNLLIGSLLTRRLEEAGTVPLLTYWTAMALHFLVNDFGLRKHYREEYDRHGRWLLAAAVIAGQLVGVFADVHETIVVLTTALIGGGILMNVLKEELPEDRRSRFSAFALGAAGYSALLLAV